jgi:23S rRNA pseudoU1915 N3-methylase RlmH
MGNSQSQMKINFEDVQYVIKNQEYFLLINTLNETEQHCLILHTVPAKKEIELLNRFIQNNNKKVKIIIYGKNTNDEKLANKYNQLISLGFYNVYIYMGGLFEWLLLQDIYGDKEFPTTGREVDILKYKPNKLLNIALLEY